MKEQMKEQNESQEELSDVKLSNLPNKEFMVMIIKILNKSREEWMNAVRILTKN